jgi:hypothetical protein
MKIDREDVIRFHDPDFMYEIGDDTDGLGCVEIRYIEWDKTVKPSRQLIKARLTFSPEHAEAIGGALIELAKKKLTK